MLMVIFVLAITQAGSPSFAQDHVWRVLPGTLGTYINDVDVYAGNPDTIFAAWEQGLLRSGDGGSNWDTLYAPFYVPVSRVYIDPLNAQTLYGVFYSPTEWDWLYKSTDGGLTWFVVTPYGGLVAFDMQDLQTMYIGLWHFDILQSTNWGLSWYWPSSPGAANIASLVIAQSNDSILYAGYVVGIYKSTNKGHSWTSMWGFPEASPQLAVHPNDPDVVYAALWGGSVFKSTDGGANWTEKSNGLGSEKHSILEIAINPQDPDEIFLGAGSAEHRLVFRSTDGGEIWETFALGLPNNGHVERLLFEPVHNRLFAAVRTFEDSDGVYICDLTPSSIRTPSSNVRRSVSLHQNYPNPFNPSTTIRYELRQAMDVELVICNLLGQKIRILATGKQAGGVHSVIWDGKDESGRDAASGVYLCRLRAGGASESKKMILVK